ncbi:hypothetical protein PAMC26510_09350 [Caballeronia sordidicola]|uniref:Uncharacterized protein n=1 Tax=Caballeronia sordidicola TaxID=196367 RepID=A0A242N134_CABSO|nr:hypothetical protein PAMC26510_09350 [Caballeronia sordidicola]
MAVGSGIKHDLSCAFSPREPIIAHIQNTPTHKQRFCGFSGRIKKPARRRVR